jgi:hypothetical protein
LGSGDEEYAKTPSSIGMTSRDETPVACTLGGNDYRERLAWIAQLNRDGLRSHRREAMALELHYAAAVRDRVHQLVRQEAECCPFLTFTVNESDEQVSVTISVPERAAEIADDLLAPFLEQGFTASEQNRRDRHVPSIDGSS